MPPPIFAILFEHSREKVNPDLMREEWIAGHRELSDDPQECPCGQKGIKELCYIRNVLNGVEMFIGNECILHLVDDGVGLCSECRLYPCVSHSAHKCRRCGRGTKDKPTGFLRSGKWKGTRYDDPILHNYARWAIEPENSMKVDPHYLVYIRRVHDIKIKTARLEFRRRRIALAKTESLSS